MPRKTLLALLPGYQVWVFVAMHSLPPSDSHCFDECLSFFPAYLALCSFPSGFRFAPNVLAGVKLWLVIGDFCRKQCQGGRANHDFLKLKGASVPWWLCGE